MLKNYLKIALRNLRRHPFYAFVNIFGLALGIACCILIILFVRDEWSYDRFHENADRIYRVALFEHYEDHDYLNTVTPFRFASMFEDNIPEVEAAVRYVETQDMVRRGDVAQSEIISFADPEFFEVFDFTLLRGEPAGVLRNVNDLVLSESAALQWFGSEDPIGKRLSLNIGQEPEDFVVTGIIEEIPSTSSIQCDYLISIENAAKRWSEGARQSLFNVFAETFLLLPAGYDIAEMEAKMPAMIEQVMGEDYEEGAYVPMFQKLTDIHLNTDFPGASQPVSDPRYSYILAIIAAFVLLIACINFMTLTLSRSADRAKEVGVRKTLGAMRGQVAGQFWGETVWYSVFGLVLGLVIAWLALPAFNALAEKELSLAFDGVSWLAIGSLVVVVGLIAGSYPSLFLSRFRPIEVLKGRLALGEANTLRKSLTVLQFALAIMLIVSTLVMRDQLRFLQDKNLGFDREQVVSIQTGIPRPEGMQLLERFRNELGQYTSITGITASLYTFGEPWISAGYEGTDDVFRQFNVNIVDVDFLKTMEIPIVAGRDFSRDIPADEREAIIINRAFAELHGWTDPIDNLLPGANFETHRIIGMVDDFNYASLHTEVEPLALVLTPEPLFAGLNDVSTNSAPQPKLLVKLDAGRIMEGLQAVEAAWGSVAPSQTFSYSFVDDAVEQQYRQEARLGTIVGYATMLVILIACLGLFGLASLIVIKRTKEIGVRKVMGASSTNIVTLLTRDFVQLVVVAFVFAAPVAYFAMRYWLSDFAYATTLKAGTFVLAGMLAALIATLTVSYQSVKAARANPVDSLRYE